VVVVVVAGMLKLIFRSWVVQMWTAISAPYTGTASVISWWH